ncbi:MAG TPA: thiamine pyrophosphate-dependent enzyme, partial [Thermoanaerobaculia bacterium]|nr:thiamine pyrophosphate-dependent enzyme [Thermoanaerobaculia bacterium]
MVNDSEDVSTPEFTAESVIRDYRVAFQSRQTSLIGRREVLTGKAKFGIFGDGKEVAQVALARAFRPGDIRSGYYRDQTLMFALGVSTIDQFFAQLYADPDLDHDPASGGRQMNCHFATRALDDAGSWKAMTERFNSSPDLSPTGSQMPRLVGLAYASKVYRQVEVLRDWTQFSREGNEIAYGTLGNASCAEGMVWESINAAGVLQVPMLLSIWDDGYGISVPNELQITKGDLSELLEGFRRTGGSGKGFDLYRVRGWDYPALCEAYLNASAIVRMEHVPAIVHVVEMTQPQGHSTSGSHERYKSRQRLQWEEEFDCLRKMREWMLGQGIATAGQLDQVEQEDRELVRVAQRRAWDQYREPIEAERKTLVALAGELAGVSSRAEPVDATRESLERQQTPFRRDLMRAAASLLVQTRSEESDVRRRLLEWRDRMDQVNRQHYGADLYSEATSSPLNVDEVPAVYREDSPVVNGFEVLNACFDAALARMPELSFMGEDVGKLGDVNQGCAGLQE